MSESLEYLETLLIPHKVTLNTIQFEEVERPGGLLVVRTLYVQKKALARLGNPDALELVLRPVTKKGRD